MIYLTTFVGSSIPEFILQLTPNFIALKFRNKTNLDDVNQKKKSKEYVVYARIEKMQISNRYS